MIGIIINPNAGKGKALIISRLIKRELKKRKILYKSFLTRNAKDIKKALCFLKNIPVEKIALLGGDGTLFYTVNFIDKNWKIPFSLFPSGSANDFLNTVFEKKRNFDFYLKNLIEGKVKKTFLGELKTHRIKLNFVNALGFGIDALIAKRALKITSLQGLPRYLVSLLIEIKNKKNLIFYINYGEKNLLKGKYIILGVGIGKTTGGGFKLFPYASPFKRKLSVCMIRNMNIIKTLIKLPHVIKGTHLELDEVEFFETEELEVKTDQNIYAQFDGEVFYFKEKNFKIYISEKSFPILTPPRC